MSFLLISVVHWLGCESTNVDNIVTHKNIFVLVLRSRGTNPESPAVPWARPPRQGTMLKTLTFLSHVLLGQASSGAPSRCGRHVVRAVACLRLCDRHVHQARALIARAEMWVT